MPEQLLISVIDIRTGMVTISNGAKIPVEKFTCPECESIHRNTRIEDMGSGARYRIRCPHGHEWEFLP